MTREQFLEKYRPRLRILAADAWALRKERQENAGMAFDAHFSRVDQLLEQMFKDLVPPPPANGAVKPAIPAKGVTR